MTGSSPSRHGVPADQRLGERGVRSARYWHSSHVQGPTLWYAAQQAGMAVAALDWPATLGASIPLLVPDVAPTRRGETWLGLLNETATPRLRQILVDAAGQGPEADRLLQTGAPGPLRDSLMVTAACAILTEPAPPGLLLMRLRQTEPVLAATGTHGPEVRTAFARVDAEIGRVVRCLEQSGRVEASALVVLGDRAFQPVHTAVRPNVALAAAGLLNVSTRGAISSWAAIARSNGTSAFVYAKDVNDALAARGVVEEEAGRTGAFRVVPAEAILGLGADPEAWFGLEAEPGYVFLNPAGGPLVHPAPQLASGGGLEPGTAAPGFVAWGRGVRAGLRIPTLRQTDVAPTLAQLLGVELPGAEGRQLVGALRLSSPLPAVSLERLVPGGLE